jgi:hypothetical protein
LVGHFDELAATIMARNSDVRKFPTSVVLKDSKGTLEQLPEFLLS